LSFLALFISLPTKASTGRMRVWRSVKALGCATLRDGVYLLPDTADNAAALDEVAAQAAEAGGSGEVYRLSGCDEAQEAALRALFDRGEEYAGIAEEIKELGRSLTSLDGAAAARKLQALVRRFEQVARIDFFPGEAQRQTLKLLDDLRDAITRRLSPDEPTAREADVPRLGRSDYQGRTWATRARPWVDRLASAWLIRRFIDPSPSFKFVDGKGYVPEPDELRFDMADAEFTHEGDRCTFETLVFRRGLDGDPALFALAEIVHDLDIADGKFGRPEAAGIAALVNGICAGTDDDVERIAQGSGALDGFYAHFTKRRGS